MSEILHILIVEDNQADVDLIRETLPDTGLVSFQVESVSRLSEALARLKNEGIDLVLLDLGLPDSQGLGTFHKLREAATDIPVIILTGNDDQQASIAAVRDGAQDYLIKGQVGGNLLMRAALYALERNRAEHKIQKIAREWQSTFDSITDSVCLLDFEGRITQCNQATERFLGKTKDEIIGRPCWNVIHGTPNPIHECPMPRMKKTQQRETLVLLEDSRWLKITVDPVLDEAGNLYGAVHIVEDITDRKRTEEALREVEERYRTLFTRAGDGIFILSVNGELVEVNESLARMHGYSVQEMLHMSLNDLDTPETSQLAPERMRRVSAGEALTFEVEHYHKGGHVFPLEVTASLVSSGGKSYVQCFHRDITERKRADEQLQESLDSLRKAVNTTIQVMVSAVETRDPYTAGHQIRSADLAHAIATEMGLPQEKIDGIRMAGKIHDIGKLSIPAEILSKPSKLSELEFSMIKEHARKGFEMLKDVESPWSLAEIVYQHHERMDGSGYPRNLKGEEILIEARILAVADVVEAMASHRPYRAGLGINAALDEIEKNRRIFYDDAVADACLRLFREKGFKLEGLDYK